MALQSLTDRCEEISISAVAAEAGFTPALIHNSYSDLAEDIRTAAGKAIKVQLEEHKRLLADALGRNADLRAENRTLDSEVKNLASENEALRREMAVQQAVAAGKVRKLRP